MFFFFSWLAFSIEAVVSTGVRTTKSMEFDLLKCLTFATGYDTPWVNHHDNRLSTMKRQVSAHPKHCRYAMDSFREQPGDPLR